MEVLGFRGFGGWGLASRAKGWEFFKVELQIDPKP